MRSRQRSPLFLCRQLYWLLEPQDIFSLFIKVFNSINSQIDPKRAVPKGGHVDQTDPKIFVGSLGQDIVEADLIEYFAQFGEVKGAKIMFDKVTRQSRGFGFVFFERVETAIHVLEMNASAEIKGRTVIWNWSLSLD